MDSKKYSPEVVLACIDRVSEYAVQKKISAWNLWDCKNHDDFIPTYNRLIKSKLLRFCDKKNYKVFISAGHLYLRFLKEMPFNNNKIVTSVEDEYQVKSDSIPQHSSDRFTDPEIVIAWLVTQPNANGTLYLESVVRQYMRALRTVPTKLEIKSPIVNNWGVFSCQTPEELTAYWDLLKSAPNYKQVNISTSGMFSAGMGCYLRYLEYLENDSFPNVTTATPINTVNRKLVTGNFTISFENSSSIDTDTSAAINIVLAKYFKNGLRYSNGIELSRLRRLIKEQLGKEVINKDDEIVEYIRSQGTEYAGKIYIILKETEEQIKQLVEEYFKRGAEAIFYSEFYAKHEPWLIESSIVSEEMLNEFLRVRFKKYLFSQTCFGRTNDSVYNVLQREILRVWGKDILVTYKALAERLVYVPKYRIEQHLGQNNDFIWNSKGEFTHISKIDIAEYEKREIANYIESKIRTHGYASISDVSLSEIIDRNYVLSTTAIHNAVYFICLAEKYSKNGKIITRKGGNIDALQITKGYCKTLDRCNLDDLLTFERNLTGVCHRWIPMQAGYEVLVRVDEDTFVAERYVHFDTMAIDTAIEFFMHGGEYIPLQSVTTFAMLPHCGQVWNLFLLESYCRRFSDDFRFECLSVNSKNAGVIVRKTSRLSYDEIMIDAVSKSDIPLSSQPVLNFLVENGYLAARRYTKVTELINQAKAIRNTMKRG